MPENFVKIVDSYKGHTPYPLQVWTVDLTVDAGLTADTVESSEEVSGLIEMVEIIPTTLTAAALIELYEADSGLTTIPRNLSYTVPNPAAQVTVVANGRKLVAGTLTAKVSSATAADSVKLRVYVNPMAAAQLGNPHPSDFEPNGTQADQQLTVDATAGGVQFATLHSETTHVLIDVQDAPVRMTIDSSAPTTSNGHVLDVGYSAIWSKAFAEAAKFIRDGGTDGLIHLSPLKV